MIPQGWTYKQARQYLAQQNAQWPNELAEVPKEQWPPSNSVKRFRLLRSKRFFVQVVAESNGVIRLTVNRTAIQPNGDWVEGITWQELQDLKRQAGYGSLFAVEAFPSDAEVVNVANMRHLWILPEIPNWAWGKNNPHES